jgi:hypothetical protein
MSAMGAMQQSKSAKAQAEYSSAVARNNQTMANWNAADALARGQKEEDAQRLKTAQMKGSQRASMAARGLDISEGSALNILSDTDFMGEQDALTVRNNAKRSAWAYQNQAQGFGADAEMQSAVADAQNPMMAGVVSVIGGAGNVADKWKSGGGTSKSMPKSWF